MSETLWDGGATTWDAGATHWDYVAAPPAPPPPAPSPPAIAPTFTQQLWSEAVGLANAEGGLPAPIAAYQFSNGAKFGDAEKAYSELTALN